MMKKPEVVAFIPARGGSKGIPRKNIVDLCGRPLVAYSILAAKYAKLVSRVIVSTEDDEIAEVARAWGAEVPFLRPKELADDASNIGHAITHSLNKLKEEGYKPDVLLQLYPTHLFRTAKLIDDSVSKIIEGYNQVRTVKKIVINDRDFYVRESDQNIKPLIPLGFCRTKKEKSYWRTYGTLLANNLNNSAFKGIYLHELKDPISLIDIDNLRDYKLAESVIKQGLFNFDYV